VLQGIVPKARGWSIASLSWRLVCDSIHHLCVTGIWLGYRPGSLRRIFTGSYSLPPLSSRHLILQSQRENTEYFWTPWSYDSNKSRIKTIRGSYKRLCPNHRVQHVLKSVLDSTQCWSKTDKAPLFDLRFRWMTTSWKGNFINFSIELYFDICSVLDRG
jgi:hypothetical protein